MAEKMFLKLSKLATKAGKNDLSKKLEHKSWLKGRKGPQHHFQTNGWKGKSNAELMEDPSYLRYLGFDDKWLKAQQKRGTLFTADDWIKLWVSHGSKAHSGDTYSSVAQHSKRSRHETKASRTVIQ
ncbi:hypothetical protein DVH05_021443 [Phytophthora capsici]|nr:hypothetical protein DVH05_021443 [Phytophthora capsici]